MTKVYACLAGEWACLNDDESCVMGPYMKTPYIWYEENAEIFSPFQRTEADTYYQLDYVEIFYRGKEYRINPIFIQIVKE